VGKGDHIRDRQVTLDDRDGWQEVVIEHASDAVRAIVLTIDSVHEGASVTSCASATCRCTRPRERARIQRSSARIATR
jgi:hypothetical protein